MKRRRVIAPLLTVLALSLVLVACGRSNTAGQPAATTITVNMHDIYFGESSDNVANPR